ncbi:MAG: hypothetical protein RLZ98_3312 [Pseudomonadota bacterium]|jgi:CBS domain containing-hemolysin-like protein
MDLSFFNGWGAELVAWLGFANLDIRWQVLGQPDIIARLVLQVVLFACSATFSMSETALFSLREADIEKLEATDPAQADRIRALTDEPRRLIVSILCGNELINIAATINLAGILLALFGSPEAAGVANTLIMLPLLLILGEITPKTLAVTKPLAISSAIVEPVQTRWVRIVAPLRWIVRLVADFVTTRIIGEARNDGHILAPDEFRTFLREVEKEGVVNRAERRLITHLIDASDTRVTEIMVPRPQVRFIDAADPPAAMIDAFRRFRHRRVPVFRERRDNIIGVMKEERVLEVATRKAIADITLDDLIAPPTLVPTTVVVGELAEFFKAGEHHAVILVNEFGGVEGLVSSDDVFGYLTHGRGVYLDAHSSISEPAPGAFLCDGLMPLRDLRRISGLDIGRTSAMATVGGHVMELLGRVPKAGDEIVEEGLVMRVVAMDHLLVDRVLVAPERHYVLTAEDTAEAAK